jgi:hypothetical protein
MINLIPPFAQKDVMREYWIRAVSIWLMLIATGLLVVCALTVPSYVLIDAQLAAYGEEYAQAGSKNEALNAAKEEILRANKTASLLLSGEKSMPFSDVLAKLDALTGSDIRITNFTLKRDEKGLGPITVQGTASTRSALTSFVESLKNSDDFKSADLPLSNLAKDRDIPFSITITPKP